MDAAGSRLVDDLEDLYEHAPCGYLVLTSDGRIAKVNATFCEWTGHSRQDLTGKHLRDLLNVSGRIFYETHFAPLLRMQGFFNEVALDVMTPAGAKVAVLANASERRTPEGELISTRITLFQATQRRRYERELVYARNAAEAASRSLSEGLTAEKDVGELREQFIAVLGHDLRNPLSSVDAGIRMLLRQELDEKSIGLVHAMQASTARMGRLIENILDFARGRLGTGVTLNIEAGRLLKPTLEQVISEIQSSYPDRVLLVDLDVDVPVDVDHDKIGQLFSNLLGNAIMHGDPAQPIRIGAKTDASGLMLFVANAGEPIPSEAMEHLFLPFHRGTVRPSQQGLGLGLYIASQIALAHSGRIDVVSNGQETRFTFSMPGSGHTEKV
jgi:sigma-B regulation protein RsbU (phosphoserine phosphatase)